MNSSYIGWKFVGFMKDHELFFSHLYQFLFFLTILEFIVDI